MNKLYPIAIRIIIFIVIYLPLAAISFYSKPKIPIGIMVFVAFFASKPAHKYVIKKIFPDLNKE
jgi:hypothetical protein